jgi:methyl-accepting chemotaxis protein
MKKSLKFRLLTWGCGSIFGVAAGLTLYSSLTLKDVLFEKAKIQSEQISSFISGEIENSVLAAKESTITMTAVLNQLNEKNAISLQRPQMIEILSKQLDSNSGFFGTYVLFESNAFDKKDSEFANTPFHDKTGRFIPYLTRKAGGGVNIEPLVDYESETLGAFYQVPKKTKKIFITPPYEYPVNGKKVLMISIVSPILNANEFKGIAGIDMSLDFFENLINKVNVPPGSKIIIFDDKGTVVGFTGNKSAILKNIFTEKFAGYNNFTQDRLTNFVPHVLDADNLSVLYPIKFAEKDWYVETVIPKSTIMAPILNALYKQIAIGLGLALAFILFGLWMLDKIAKNVTVITERLEQSTEQNRIATESVKDTSSQVASATSEQAAAIEETAATLDEISAMVSKSVENARLSTSQSENSLATALKGKHSVEQVIKSIHEINESNNDIMVQINEGNDEIRSIINLINDITEKTKVINDIVFQTKLLSFNASVEAARAGENGKGFAVVAEEIGKLAEMSGTSAKDINSLLENSSRNVESIIKKMQERISVLSKTGKIKIDEGVKVADQCGMLLDEIVLGADRVKAMMIELADANSQQSEGIKNITDAMGMLQVTTQANSNSVNLMANNTEKLFKETVVLADNTVELKKEVFGSKVA